MSGSELVETVASAGVRTISLKFLFLAVGWVLLALSVYLTLVAELSPQLLLAVLLLNALNILFIHLAFITDNRFLKVYVFAFLHWYALRLPVLLVAPETHSFVDWPTWVLTSFTYDDLERSVTVLLFYHFLTGFVIAVLGSFLRPGGARPTGMPGAPGMNHASSLFGPLFGWFVILAIYQLVSNVVLQLGRDPTGGGITGYLNLLFSKDLVVHVLWFLGLMSYKSFDAATKKKFWAFIVLNVLAELSGGGRAGMIGLLYVAVIYFLVRYRNFAIRMSPSTIALSGGIVIFSLVTLYIGHIYRPLYRDPSKAELSVKAVLEAASNSPWLLTDWLNWVSLRSSQFDIFSMMVIQEESRFEHMISFSNAFKMLGNWMVPRGDVFSYGVYRLEPATRSVFLDYAGVDKSSTDAVHTDQLGLLATAVAYFGSYQGITLVLGILVIWMPVASAIGKVVPSRYRELWHLLVYWLFDKVLNVSGVEWLIFFYVLLLGQVGMFFIYRKLCSWQVEVVRPRRAGAY